MLKYIQDALYCHLPHIPRESYYQDSLFIAEAVLQTIEGGNPEDAGMWPPEYNKNANTEDKWELVLCRVNEWESE